MCSSSVEFRESTRQMTENGDIRPIPAQEAGLRRAPWGWVYNARMPDAARESTQSAPAPPSLYETDLYSWTREQAAALRRRDLAAIDWDNVTEEIESLGRSEVRAWTSTATQAIRHMLKIQYWPSATEAAVSGWMKEVWTFRRAMADTITENPGLQARYAELLEKAWRAGRDAVIDDLVVDGARSQRTAPPGGSPCGGSGSRESLNSARGRLRRSWRMTPSRSTAAAAVASSDRIRNCGPPRCRSASARYSEKTAPPPAPGLAAGVAERPRQMPSPAPTVGALHRGPFAHLPTSRLGPLTTRT